MGSDDRPLRNALEAAQGRARALEVEKKRLETSLAAAETRRAAAEAERAAVEGEWTARKALLARTEAELVEFKMRVAPPTKERDRLELLAEVNRLKAQVERLNRRPPARVGASREAPLQREAQALEGRTAAAEESARQASHTREELAARLAEASERGKNLQRERDELAALLAEASERGKNLQRERDELAALLAEAKRGSRR